MSKVNYVDRLKEAIGEVSFDKKPEKVSLEELRRRAEKVRKTYDYETYTRAKLNFKA